MPPSMPPVPPLPGEQLLWSARANQTQSSARAVGGRLYLTNRRLLFAPHALDNATGGTRWGADLAAITEVGTEPRTWNPFDGGLRSRLRIVLADGTTALFVVNRLTEVQERIRAALASARA